MNQDKQLKVKGKPKGQGVQGSLKLAGDTFEQATSRVHEFHRAISNMPFKAVGTATFTASKPVEQVHNEITDLVYDIVKETGKGVFKTAGWLAQQWNETRPSREILSEVLQAEQQLPVTPDNRHAKRLSLLSGAINGLLGDHLAATRNPIQIKAGFYRESRLLDLSAQALSAEYPDASGHLVVFAHGLCCDENVWNLYQDETDPATTPYPDRLAKQFGVTPLCLRYNTGLNIEGNGRRYRRLLKRLVANWPVPVKSVVLVGHSMGGLISRVAVQDMGEADLALSSVITDVISLGSPHTGSPVARLAGKGEQLFSQFELSRPVSKVLGVRSTGIRNLQTGLGPLQTSDGQIIDFHMMGATLGGQSGSWVDESLGDGLVQMSSALADDTGKAQRLAFSAKHHMRLVNDPEIYQQIEAVIRRRLTPLIG
ncbi:MAG: alpha/beta hydrolase [Limnobacter sp.]|nr:alpha/beta hydrolase [Limnobacter sp.]